MKTKAVVAIVVVVLLGIILVSSNIRVTRLERSYYCDEYKVSINTPLYISEVCIKKGK